MFDLIFDFSYYLTFSDELLVILFLLNISKLLFLSTVVELIWPTHIFNKKHVISYTSLRWRSFNEFLLKLRSNNLFKKTSLAILLKYNTVK